MPFQLLEIAEGLSRLDPIRGYPRRGAALVARLSGLEGYRLELAVSREVITSDPPPNPGAPMVSLPLRNGRRCVGTLHLCLRNGEDKLASHEMRLARWGARVLARGIDYARRLAAEGVRRDGEAVRQTLARAPLTPREKDVVALLVAGSTTRGIAAKTGLTVATVNTYLKRIFQKLGVHSRVELIARMAGTELRQDPRPAGGTNRAEEDAALRS